jgi:TonB family protein
MLLDKNPELEIPPKRGKTLIISVLVHVVLVAIIAFEPGLFDSSLKRVIRIQGNDDEVRQLTELSMAPVPKPVPAPPPKVEESKPLVEPPPVKTPPPEAAPPPPPPPPPPPVRAIAPDDIIAPGARPDGQTQASRGSTSEQQRNGGASGDSTPQAPQAGRGASQPPAAVVPATPPAVANTNPNAMTVPNLLQQANRNADQIGRALQRSGSTGTTMGPKTGRSNAPNGQNFSADGGVQIRSDTKGYDFGTYLNQVLNKVRNNWFIPDLARFGARGRVIVDFTITKNGDVVDCHIYSESGERSLDGAAKSAIDSSNPFQRLPDGFSGNELQLRFGFYYNMPVE